MFGDNFVLNCTRHSRPLFVHFDNCEMSILSNDAVQLLLQCVCDDRGSPWSLSVMNICSPIPKHCATFSDPDRVHNTFAIDCNKSSVNFTGSNRFRLQNPNHASHLSVGGIWYRRVHCHNPLHSQHEKHQLQHITIYTLLNTTNYLIWYNETPALVVCANVLYFPNSPHIFMKLKLMFCIILFVQLYVKQPAVINCITFY